MATETVQWSMVHPIVISDTTIRLYKKTVTNSPLLSYPTSFFFIFRLIMLLSSFVTHFPHYSFSTLLIFHTPHFSPPAFSTLLIFHIPHFPYSSIFTFLIFHTPHSAHHIFPTSFSTLRTPHSAHHIFPTSFSTLRTLHSVLLTFLQSLHKG